MLLDAYAYVCARKSCKSWAHRLYNVALLGWPICKCWEVSMNSLVLIQCHSIESNGYKQWSKQQFSISCIRMSNDKWQGHIQGNSTCTLESICSIHANLQYTCIYIVALQTHHCHRRWCTWRSFSYTWIEIALRSLALHSYLRFCTACPIYIW